MKQQHASESKNEMSLRQKIAKGSHDPEDYRELGAIYVSSARAEDAVALYERGLGLATTGLAKARISIELAWLLYEMGQDVEALPLADRALSLVSDEPETWRVLLIRGLSQSLLAHCRWFTDERSAAEAARMAVGVLERVIAGGPEPEATSTACCEAARLKMLLGQAAEAVALCKRALQEQLAERDRIPILIALGDALRREARFTEAEEKLEEALRTIGVSSRQAPVIYFALGMVQRSTNRFSDAIESFERAAEGWRAHGSDPHSTTAVLWQLSELYYDSRDYGKAAEALRKILVYHSEDDEDHRKALVWLGHCHLAIGDVSKAQSCYEELLHSPAASEQEKAMAVEGLQAVPGTPWSKLGEEPEEH